MDNRHITSIQNSLKELGFTKEKINNVTENIKNKTYYKYIKQIYFTPKKIVIFYNQDSIELTEVILLHTT